MRSSTLNPKLQTVVREDPRFQALVKQEMAEHQHIISEHHREMQSLRDALKMTLERLNSLYEQSQRELHEKTATLNTSLERVQYKLKIAEGEIEDHKQTISDLSKEIEEVRCEYTRHSYTESLRQYIDAQFNLYSVNYSNRFQEHQKENKDRVASLVEEIVNINECGSKRDEEVDQKIEHKFSLCQLDREGVLKEIRQYKKSMLIIEKKIEHLYILLERITKRGATCHKPD